MKWNCGFLYTHVAVVLFGLAGLFAKLIQLSPYIIVLGRVVFASLFILLVLAIKKISIRLLHKKDYSILFITGVLLAIHWVTFFAAIQVADIATGLLSFSTFPIFVSFLEPIFFKQHWQKKNLLISAITFLGLFLVVSEWSFSSRFTQGALLGMMSGLTFALISIINRKLVMMYSSLVIAFYQDVFAAIVLIPVCFIVRFQLTCQDLYLLFLLGIVFTGIAHSLFIYGLKFISAHSASIIASLEPIYGIIAAMLLFGDFPEGNVYLGGMIIIGCNIFIVVRSNDQCQGYP